MNKEKLLKKSDPYDDEEVVLAIKAHPLFFGKVIIYGLVFLVLILISFYFFGASKITSIILVIAILIIGFLFTKCYIQWSNTYYLITNHRVISQIQKSWFKKSMSEANLEDIQMLSHEINGFWNNLFLDRGDVYIRASGVEGGDVVFKNIPNPYEIEKKISKIKKQYTGTSVIIEEDESKNKQRPIIR